MTAFTEKHLLRCYPAGHGFLSDNYDLPGVVRGRADGRAELPGERQADVDQRGKFLASRDGFVRQPRYLTDPAQRGALSSPRRRGP